MQTSQLTDYLNTLLNVEDITDESLNGLQVANKGSVTKVGLAVDAALATFERAREEGVDFLILHHGLFWGKPSPIRGAIYSRIKLLMDADIAVYAAHLPLDMHPEFGNNAQIAKVMGWETKIEFGHYHGSILGKEVHLPSPVGILDIVGLLEEKLDCKITLWDFGPDQVSKLAFVSGGGVGMLEEAIDQGMDAYLTGEPKHSAYWTAQEAGIHVMYGGHYATETLGVKALGRQIQAQFDLPTVFIDLPTGY